MTLSTCELGQLVLQPMYSVKTVDESLACGGSGLSDGGWAANAGQPLCENLV